MSDYDLFSLGMMQAISDDNLKIEARSLALVLFWRAIAYETNAEVRVWNKVAAETKENVKVAIMNLLETINHAVLSKQIADLASELAETLYYVDKAGLWNDLLNKAYAFVESQDEIKI